MTVEAKGRQIQLAQPSLGERERQLIEQVLASHTLALGPMAEAFEDGIARIAGRRFGVSCSSGTAGLHMAVRALGIRDGDEVITTPFSFVASANCILYERARPVFIDIEEDSLGMDPALLEMAAGPRTVGVLPVHVFGRPCRIEAIASITKQHGWHLIEDACEALGTRVGARPAGSFGAASVFAFYPNKQITTGEGGAVVTDDPALAASFRSLRNQGRDEDGTWLRHIQLGYNYRLDELSAAVGVAQLERIDELRAGRARVAAGVCGRAGTPRRGAPARCWPGGGRRLVRLRRSTGPGVGSRSHHGLTRVRRRAHPPVLQPASPSAPLPCGAGAQGG